MAGFSSGSGYLDPHRVYELVIRRMPALLLEYLDSVPVPSRDMHWQGIRLVGNALRNLLSQVPRSSSVEDNRDILSWAQLAQFHAIKSRSVARDGRFCLGLFCAPQMVGKPSNFTSIAGHHMLLGNSSSSSRRMLNREPDSNELIHSAASSSRTPAAIPLQEKNYDVHRHAAMYDPSSSSSSKIAGPPLKANTIINFPTRRAGMRDETSASNSGTHASAYIPLRDNSMLGGSAAPERHGGAPLLRKTKSRPPRAATSSPPRAVSSPPRTPLPPRRRTLPLRTCQRRILSVPEPVVEQATSAPPLREQAPQLRRGRDRRALDSWPIRQTTETVRVVFLSNPKTNAKPFIWAKAVKSLPDDDE